MHLQTALEGKGAEVMQAVPTMLELVPRGVNKWVGLQALLPDLALPVEAVMAIGDGSNDLQIVANAGLGVAMGNAVPEVRDLRCHYSFMMWLRSLNTCRLELVTQTFCDVGCTQRCDHAALYSQSWSLV